MRLGFRRGHCGAEFVHAGSAPDASGTAALRPPHSFAFVRGELRFAEGISIPKTVIAGLDPAIQKR
jgi:hypothetical protein